MFTREITGLTLTSQVANDLFSNIKGDSFGNDVSFLATLRALLYKRVPEQESIFLRYIYSNYSAEDISIASKKDCVRAFLRNTHILRGDPGQIVVHSFYGSGDANEAAMQTLDEGIKILGDGYTALPDIDKWMEQHGNTRSRIFINNKLKNVIIFISDINIKRWHLIQSLIPRYIPWYFENAPLEEDEVVLLRSLTKRYAPDYEKLIQDFSKRFDFRSQNIRRQLAGFEDYFERNKLQETRRDIENVRGYLLDLETSFADYYRRLNELSIQELGLIEKLSNTQNEQDSEFLEYFLCNKSLNIVSVNGGRIEFIVTTALSNYDPDLFDSTIKKKGKSFFYRHYQTKNPYANKEMTDDRIERLMNAIFRDELLKLRVCAAYRLDFANGNYNALQNYSFPADILRDHTPNQHIQHYACLGNNQTYIRKAMLARDYVGAVSHCCSSASNINLTESNTGTFFMENICGNNPGNIIQMPDGSTKTPLEAVLWLEEQEAVKLAKEEKKEEAANE